MPSYDIIPLASDLLDYTIQRVKQKEAEYKPVKAYIMVGDQLVEKLLYDKVKDDGKPHFPKSQTFLPPPNAPAYMKLTPSVKRSSAKEKASSFPTRP